MHNPERLLLRSRPSQVRLLWHILRAFLGGTVMFCPLWRVSCFEGLRGEVVSVTDSPVRQQITSTRDELALLL